MASLIRQLRPNIILTHFPFEHGGLGDHAVTGQMVVRAIDYAAGVDPGDRNPPVRVEQVFFFGQGGASVRNGLWDAAGGYTNDVFIDITDVIDKKFAAMECLVSQGYAGAYNRKRTENGDGAFGGGTAAYGEGFIRMNAEVHYLLPLTPYARRRTRRLRPRDHGPLLVAAADARVGLARIAADVDPDGVLRALGGHRRARPDLFLELLLDDFGRLGRSSAPLDADRLLQVVQSLTDRAGQLVLADEQLAQVGQFGGRRMAASPSPPPLTVGDDEEVGDEAGQHAEQGDAGDQQERADHPPRAGHGEDVAVADGRDRDEAPPDRVARRVDVRAGRVLLRPETRLRPPPPRPGSPARS